MSHSCKLLQGRVVADIILNEIKNELQCMHFLRAPCVAFLRVGNNGASVSYVAQKEKVAHSVGIKSVLKVFDSSQINEDQLVEEIKNLNLDTSVDGILVQSPLPKAMDFVNVCNAITSNKDVDGFGTENLGRLLQGKSGFTPCTPAGIVELLKFYNISPAGKHVVIVNRSLIVGKPLAALLTKDSPWGNATVTLCHSHSKNLPQLTRQADILVLACGKPGYFDSNFVRPETILIDVGITRVSDGSSRGYFLQGDANFEAVSPIVQAITPVPGGVGPLTVALLMRNTLKAFKLQNNFAA
ncbi:MAG: bifunctional 5,10-methylenetetrahydrofolate dehydrogenase/5,10-methenyltetrahydrofolate cyclohydrolase [Puniceicoccales bacterium]|jgi:methylenetetrahydrofolate dehydrogenase (NADP+)/methenyltetrahydrofolate cyclohydrolase|nr:bifunctional 5,10-methylenetetrahydrofolate dehydrogenase/5,10-methenyltetrahydrofolate cyclohydrolase [Puniceicoccales bacterium]